jgi:hypothetical protein
VERTLLVAGFVMLDASGQECPLTPSNIQPEFETPVAASGMNCSSRDANSVLLRQFLMKSLRWLLTEMLEL